MKDDALIVFYSVISCSGKVKAETVRDHTARPKGIYRISGFADGKFASHA